MHQDADACYRAIASRDRRFEGRFIVGVATTGVYCRPGCPARIPERRNVTFFACAAAAEAAGYRACMRCRPESAPGTPAWIGSSSTVARALRLLVEGAAERSIAELSGRLGVGERHLRRLFATHVGAAPRDIVRSRRLHLARALVDQTDLKMAEVALASGFASVRRFNDAFRIAFRRAPSAVRSARAAGRSRAASEAGASSGAPGELVLRLPYAPPYDWEALLGFLAARAAPGVEAVTGGAYRRTISVGDAAGTLEVRRAPPRTRAARADDRAPAHALELRLRLPPGRDLLGVVERVSRMFDLGADPRRIAAHLAEDPLLAGALAAHPGTRVPGAWDPFELAVRAILGQQVTVAHATRMAGQLAALFGAAAPTAHGDLSRLFPTATALAEAPIERVGMPGARAAAIRRLARAVRDRELILDGSASVEDATARMIAIPGVGPWTASYVAMRALGEPDAFLPGDLGLRKAWARATGKSALPSPRELAARAERWRPWRSYAALYLWSQT